MPHSRSHLRTAPIYNIYPPTVLLSVASPRLGLGLSFFFFFVSSILYPMGNLLSGQAHDGKVVLPDGTVLEFDRPTSVAELMLEHPRQYVLDLTSLSAADNSNAAPLPADHMLEVGKAYVMLPMARGRATGLSTGEARRVLAAIQSMTKILQPTCTRTAGAEWHGEEFEAGAEFFRRQHLSKRWKPSLGTIEEESLERKTPHWLF
ncbi:hypothetical protein BHE74_00053096 [Ensete ventricosum]|nr:hypothetical protein BHE74_00053096 [Ensete ventricosum]RZS27546.1 hypothetical protein BHM03_00061037 [Ensete ventricosum]